MKLKEWWENQTACEKALVVALFIIAGITITGLIIK